MKHLSSKPTKKNQRMQKVLLGLVDLYLKIGAPIGSHTLKDESFPELSSATLRNYFAVLEEMGYLQQQHSSGGRIPTAKALRLYVDHYRDQPIHQESLHQTLQFLHQLETKDISGTLCQAAETFSDKLGLAVCISAPRFDQDFVRDIKLVHLDGNRYLCALITDFGLVQTEILYTDASLSSFSLRRIESYFRSQLSSRACDELLSDEEEVIARSFYEETLVRYMLRYSHFREDDLYLTGFSKLLKLPEFQDPKALAEGLSLFEDRSGLREILRQTIKEGEPLSFIGDDLKAYQPHSTQCALMTHPYRIHAHIVGSIALLGPTRLPYRQIMGALQDFSEALSSFLTRNIYTHKLSYRMPEAHKMYLASAPKLLTHTPGSS